MPQKIQIIAGNDILVPVKYTFIANTAVSLETMLATIRAAAGAVGVGTPALYATISVENNDARYGFATGVNQSLGHILQAGDTILLEGFDEISNFLICPAAAGLYPVVQITTEF